MIELLLIADDLTGANDTGVQFARAGHVTEISVDPGRALGEVAGDVQVLVVDTETRHVEPDSAGSQVERLARRARRMGVPRFYKKTDSTLRGNVGAELEGLMRGAGARCLPFVPAYPQAGRTVEGGRLCVHGRPLHETSFARDPLAPVETSLVVEVVAGQAGVQVILLGRDDLDGLEALAAGGECVCAFDAATPDDLERVAGRLEEMGLLWCCAGAAGFAECVARRLPPRAATGAPGRPRGPLLAVNGSLHEVALDQVRLGIADGMAALRVEPSVAFAGALIPVGGELIARARRELAEGRDVLLYTVTEPGGVSEYLRAAAAAGQADAPSALARTMGVLVAAVVREGPPPGALVAFGGETAIAVLRALGLWSMRPRRELWPGVVESAVEPGGARLTFVTKSGGFGPGDLLPQLRRP